MDLKHLEYFTAVAQCGSINKAAQMLYISQPHLSHIIRDIEHDVGKKLLIRAQQGVALTPEGKSFLKHAQNILNEMQQLRGVFSTPEEASGSLRVSMTKFSHVMESFIDVCKQTADRERFCYLLNEEATMDVITSVEEKTADVGVIHFDHGPNSPYRRMLQEKRLSYTQLFVFKPHIVLSANHPLLQKGEPVTIAALRSYGFVRYIGQYEDFTYNLTIKGELVDLANAPKIVYAYGRASLLHLVGGTDFYTIGIQGFGAQSSSYGVLSLPVPDCDNELEFGYVLPQGVKPNELVEQFIHNLLKRLGNGERQMDTAQNRSDE